MQCGHFEIHFTFTNNKKMCLPLSPDKIDNVKMVLSGYESSTLGVVVLMKTV